MSDVKGVEISDVLGLSQPLIKLIDCVSGGIGKVYEPIHVNRMAKAKVHEIELISNSINENISLPISYDMGNVKVDALKAKELAKRTGSRLLFQEMQKQQNIDSVVANAYKELENEKEVSKEPVSKDWILRFFNSIEDISNEEMQQIWGKILAGEVKKPSTYSLRTLDKVRNLSREDALSFEKISAIFVKYYDSKNEIYFIFKEKDLMNKYECYFKDLLDLEECGLIKSQPVSFKFITKKNVDEHFCNNETIVRIRSNSESEIEIPVSIYALTEAGVQLYSAIVKETNSTYLLEYAKRLKLENSNCEISAHRIRSFLEDGRIVYDSENVLDGEWL